MSYIVTPRYLGLSIPILPCAQCTLYMSTTRLFLRAVETCDGIEARSHFGHIVDGLSAWPFARHKGVDVCMYRFVLMLDDQPTRAHTDRVPSRDRVTENEPKRAS
eukprot:6160978-Pleurochrysis_carterae.AAC.4